jgi:hypothetical protein
MIASITRIAIIHVGKQNVSKGCGKSLARFCERMCLATIQSHHTAVGYNELDQYIDVAVTVAASKAMACYR